MFEPFVLAKTLKACALVGLHLMAAESESGSSGSKSPHSGDKWRYGCPESPDWDSDGEWSESEGLSSSDFLEHKVESLALHVSWQKLVRRRHVPLPGGLGTCEGSFELPRSPGYVVPGNAGGLTVGLPLPGEPTVTECESLLSHFGRAVTERKGMW